MISVRRIKDKIFSKILFLNNEKIETVLFTVLVIIMVWYSIFVFNKDNKDVLFKCPHAFKTEKEYTDSLGIWLSRYMRENPEATKGEIIEVRKVLMEENNCEISKFVSGNASEDSTKIEGEDISDNFPLQSFNLYRKDFFLEYLSFSEDGDIWISSFLQPLKEGVTGTEVYASFYLKGVYKDTVSAKEEFNLFLKRKEGNLLMKPFAVTESIQGGTAYYGVSYTPCGSEEGHCVYVNIIKFSSVGENVYSIMYFKKIDVPEGKDIKNSATDWVEKNLMTADNSNFFIQLDSIKIDESVFNYITSKSK